MKLFKENYHSQEANNKYLSVSQYKDFAGTLGQPGCEAHAIAKLNGEWTDEVSTAMIVGSYVDAHFEGTLDIFKAKNPDIFKKDSSLKCEYKKADEIIQRIERDEYFMKYLQGEKQVILTGELFGVEWKCKIDSLDISRYIADLKIMKSLTETFWVKDYGHMSFVHFWGYDIQGFVYQKLVEQNFNKKLPFYLAAATKETQPDIQILGFEQQDLDDTAGLMAINIKRIIDLKQGNIMPDRCEVCDYCKFTKKLSRPIHFSEILQKVR